MARSSPDGGPVSVVIPARDEACHIERCIRSVLAQDLEYPVEVIVADGRSSDATALIARQLGVTVLENPQQSIPAALNLGLTYARGDLFVRFDAHAEMPPGYLRACLRGLAEEPAAVNIGGWIKTAGVGPWGRALGAALASPAGVGNPRLWRTPHADERRHDVDSVPFGCYRTAVLRAAGGWREDLVANEDFELNHRLRQGHGRVVFDPGIWSIYHPRETLPAIAGQYWRYGRAKGVVLRGAPESLKPRQLAPLGLLATAVTAPLFKPARLALAGYVGILAAATAAADRGWRTAPVFATAHLSWGAGLILGLMTATNHPGRTGDDAAPAASDDEKRSTGAGPSVPRTPGRPQFGWRPALTRVVRANKSLSRKVESHLPQAQVKLQHEYELVVAEYMNTRRAHLVVDVGGGRQCHFARYRNPDVGTRIVAVDIDRGEMEENHDVDEKRVADVCAALPFEDTGVDIIVSRSVLEHLPDVPGFMREAYRVLTPGGYTIHVFPSKYAPFSLLNRLLPPRVTAGAVHLLIPGSQGILGFPVHYDHTSAGGMRRVLEQSGFEVVDLRVGYYQAEYFSFFFPLYLLNAAYELLARRIGALDLAAVVLVVAHKPEAN